MVFVLRLKKLGIIGYSIWAKRRFWKDRANAQVDLNLMRGLIWIFAGRIYMEKRFLGYQPIYFIDVY